MKKTILYSIYGLIIMSMISIATAVTIETNTEFHPSDQNTTYNITADVEVTSVEVNETCMTITYEDGLINEYCTNLTTVRKLFVDLNHKVDTLYLKDGSSILFVDKEQSSCNDSYTREQALDPTTPWCNISETINKIRDGDTMYVLEGTYNGYIDYSNKTQTGNIKISTYPNNQVNLTNIYTKFLETPNTLWTQSENPNIWNSSTPDVWGETIAHHTNGSMFFIYRETNFTIFNTTNPFDAIWSNDTSNMVYLRFNDSSFNPNQNPLYIKQNQYSIVRFIDIQNVEIEFNGFNLNYNYWGILIQNSSNIYISNITTNGGTRGVYAKGDSELNIENITIENSIFNGFFSELWDWDSIHSDGGYGLNLMDSFAIRMFNINKNIIIKNNTIHDWSNGIIIRQDTNADNSTIIYNNNIYNIYDDAIELENFQSNNLVYNNKISSSFVGISLAYAECIENCSVYNNIININKTILRYGNQSAGECFKIAQSSGYLKNWDINHNTCYAIASENGNDADGIVGTPPNQFNVNWTDNIFYTVGYTIYQSGQANNSVKYDNNLYYNTKLYVFKYWNNDTNDKTYLTLSEAVTSENNTGNWDTHSIQADPLFLDLVSFQPMWESAACGAASDGGDIGAVQCEMTPLVNEVEISINNGLGGLIGFLPIIFPIVIVVLVIAVFGSIGFIWYLKGDSLDMKDALNLVLYFVLAFVVATIILIGAVLGISTMIK